MTQGERRSARRSEAAEAFALEALRHSDLAEQGHRETTDAKYDRLGAQHRRHAVQNFLQASEARAADQEKRSWDA